MKPTDFIKDFIKTIPTEWFLPNNNKNKRYYGHGQFHLCQEAYEYSLLERKIENCYNHKGDIVSKKIYFKVK